MTVDDFYTLMYELWAEKVKSHTLIKNNSDSATNIIKHNDILTNLSYVIYEFVLDRIIYLHRNYSEDSVKLIKDYNNTYQYTIENIQKEYIR